MAITWSAGHYGPGYRGFDGPLFVAQVARYDDVDERRLATGQGHWRAYLAGGAGKRACTTPEAAQAAAERAYEAG